MTQKDQFIYYLEHSSGLETTTQKQYISALSKISVTIARIKKVDTFDIYQVQDVQELDEIIGALKQDDGFKDYDKKWHNKPSAALNYYREFISGSNPVMSNNKEQNKGVDFRQIIFFGTPGSGKSYRVKLLTEKKRVHRTTFHPDSDYASFVGCYKPTMKDGEISYSFSPQVFTEAYVDAWKNPEEEVYLVIEEINRGNCAQIFGDLFQLLDRNSDGYSDYRIKADSDLRDYLYSQLGKGNEGIKNGELCLPPNLRIFATMNTSDQSLFPMDSAFKRRWDWEYIPVDYNEIRSDFVITIGEKKYHWLEFLKIVNERIRKATDSEDKQMGNFFIKTNVSEDEFKSKVMFYLWNEVCRDEYGTQNNFFRTSGEYEFSFNDLYQTDGLEKLQGFMTYLGVTTLSTTEHTDQTAEEPSEA
jgi:type II restriction-modification system restriction subunit